MPASSQRSAVPVAAAVLLAVGLSAGAIALLTATPRTGEVGSATSRPTWTTPAPASGAAALPSATPAPTASPSPSRSPSPSPSATMPPPAGPADLAISTAVVRPWTDDLGEVRAQVLVGVSNRGGEAGFVPAAATRYRVSSPTGVLMAQGRFAHVFPPYIEPGANAWFVDTLSATFADIAELSQLDVQLVARPAEPGDSDPTSVLSVTDTTWELDPAGSLVASGVVSNVGDAPVGRVSVGVILLGHDGQPLAGAYDVSVRDLAPGASAPFSTSYPGSAPVEAADVATFEAYAVALGP